MIPNWTYKVVCAHLEQRASTVTGRPYLMATQVVIEGPHAGTLIHQPLAFTDAARWIWEDVAESAFDLGGQQFMLLVTQSEYCGAKRMKGGKMQPLPDPHEEKNQRFAERYGRAGRGERVKVKVFGRKGRGLVWFE